MAPGTLIDGKAVAAKVRQEVAHKVEELKPQGIVPHLAVVLVGEDPASKIYVRNKERACQKVGIRSTRINLAADTSEEQVLEVVERLNQDDDIDGILVQLPLPPQINSERVLLAIDPSKDVDGFTPYNTGRLAMGSPTLVPCTPAGILRLLDEYNVNLEGMRAVIVGRSNIVGKPMFHLLLARHATVTVCHSRTRNLPDLTKEADVLVAAVGKPHLIKGDWIKSGAVVIDVGVNRLEDGSLVGDVDTAAALERASLVTPVPGGVGPMTVSMLLENTVRTALLRRGLPT